MKNFKITVSYDGRRLAGWQRQAEEAGPTVQGLLETALSRLCDHPVTLHGSGRTDAGVHALGQVASFTTDSARTVAQIIQGSNALLPPEVAVLRAEEAPEDFHARFSALGKRYDYELLTSPTRRPLYHGRAWWLGPGLDWAAVAAALPAFEGEKDFAAFQSVGSEVGSTVRRLHRAALSRSGPETLRLSFIGSGFLRHMVRAMVGLLAETGRGRQSAASIPELIASGDRRRSGPTAPADGLYLAAVFYDADELAGQVAALTGQAADLL
ncbi:MAG: tRNA pseudouridine(38-40) synthase TruA [Candidatus Adiutrix sp.]|jgi:tRNA pseudouridine38-40 synthase|nr:tRNA pseudouridine(38-40) synthase TruA [Candidatus Adiutrix sp.]